MPRAIAQDIKAAIGTQSGVGSFTLDTAGWTGFSGFGWFKNNTRGNTANMLSRSAGFTDRVMQIQTDDKLRFALACASGNLSVFTTKQYPKGIWNHFVATFNGTNWAIYINGVLENSGVLAVGNLAAGQGNSWAVSSTGNNATMSQFGIYNRAITATEVATLYAGVPPQAGLQRYWPMNEGAGSVLNDLSGNGGHGSVGTLAYIGDTPSSARKAVGANLVVNGNFEYAPPFTAATTTSGRWIDGTATGSTTNGLFGWATFSSAGNQAQFDPTTAHSGSRSLKLSIVAGSANECSNVPNATATNVQVFAVPIIPGVSYTLTYWMKTSYIAGDSNDGAFVQVKERNAAGTNTFTSVGTKIKVTSDWTQYSITFTAGSTSRYATVNPIISGSSGSATLVMNAWFDDIQLQQTVLPARNAATGRITVGGNPTPNSGFELYPSLVAPTTTDQRWIDGTAAGSTTNDTYRWAIGSKSGTSSAHFDTTDSHSGAASLKLSTGSPGAGVEVWSYPSTSAQNITRYALRLIEGVQYTVSYWMKTNYVSGNGTGARLVCITRGAGISASTQLHFTPVLTTTGWTFYSAPITIPVGFPYLQLQCRITGTGGAGDLIMDAWFDDISVVETNLTGRQLVA